MKEQDLLIAYETMTASAGRSNGIGTLGEKAIHAALKFYFEPNTTFHEVKVGTYVADICRGNEIVEIQTRGFHLLRSKLNAFLSDHTVTVVYPVIHIKRICVSDSESGELLSVKKSPKRGQVFDILPELYKIKYLLHHPNLHFCIPLFDATEQRRRVKPSRKNRRGVERISQSPDMLCSVTEILTVRDFEKLLPPGLPQSFTSLDFAKAAKRTRAFAQISLNVLESVGAVVRIGKDKNAYLYEIRRGSSAAAR